jgi:hypothetical protein
MKTQLAGIILKRAKIPIIRQFQENKPNEPNKKSVKTLNFF